MAEFQHSRNGSAHSQAGIAIGPILFIIAILAILAAAIAAGSGSFTATTNGDSNKTKASGLIQVGENLKVGMDRITIENGVTPTTTPALDVNPANTTDTNMLFSPTGGGIAPPSPALAANSTVDKWSYITGLFPGLGTSTGEKYVAVLNVTSDVCNTINNQVGVEATISNDLATNTIFSGVTPPSTPGTAVAGLSAIPAELSGHTVGCFGDKQSGVNLYYFYEVLFVQ
jgi:hypothetical protein